MEPLTIFAASVALVGIFHLLSTAVNRIGKGRRASSPGNAKTRSDWYCFFTLSDLYGRDTSSPGNLEQLSIQKDGEDRLEQRRRQQAQRPRLHA